MSGYSTIYEITVNKSKIDYNGENFKYICSEDIGKIYGQYFVNVHGTSNSDGTEWKFDHTNIQAINLFEKLLNNEVSMNDLFLKYKNTPKDKVFVVPQDIVEVMVLPGSNIQIKKDIPLPPSSGLTSINDFKNAMQQMQAIEPVRDSVPKVNELKTTPNNNFMDPKDRKSTSSVQEVVHHRKQITSNNDYIVVDYTKLSIALFSPTTFTDEQEENFQRIGATYNEYLTIDKKQLPGWVFKKFDKVGKKFVIHQNNVDFFKKIVNFDISAYCKQETQSYPKYQKKETETFVLPSGVEKEQLTPVDMLNNLLKETTIPFSTLEIKSLSDPNGWTRFGYSGSIIDVDKEILKFEEESIDLGEQSRKIYEFINFKNKVCIMVRIP